MRLRVWRESYVPVAGMLFHSAEEQDFARDELGVNHPGASVIGTWLECDEDVPAQSEQVEGIRGCYVIYCGRYSQQKELPASARLGPQV